MYFEDIYDEIKVLAFIVLVTSFNLLKTKFRGKVMERFLTKRHNKIILYFNVIDCLIVFCV